MQKDDENGSDDEAPGSNERGSSPINYERRNIRTLNVADLLNRMAELRQRSLKAENRLSASMTSINLNWSNRDLDYSSLISADSISSTYSMPCTSEMLATSSKNATSSKPSSSRKVSAIDLSSTRMQSSNMLSASKMPSTRRIPSTSDQPSASGQPSASDQPSASGQPSASSQSSASDYEHDCSTCSTAASTCSSGSSSPMSSCRNIFEEYEETDSSLDPFNINKFPSGCVRESPSTSKDRSYGALNIDPSLRSFGGEPMPSPEYYRPLKSRNRSPLLYVPSGRNPKPQLHPYGLGATGSTSVSDTLGQSEVIGEPGFSVDKKETGGSDATEKSKKSNNQGDKGQAERKRKNSENDYKPSKKGKAGPGQKTKNRKKCNE